MSDPLQTLLAVSTRIVKRSLLSAFYFAGLTTFMLMAPDYNSALKGEVLTWFVPLILLGIIIAHVSYEIVMPLNRKLSTPKVLKGFQDVIGEETDTSMINYDFLRSWKHKFLENPTSGRLKDELEKNLALRQQMTYLFATTIAGILVVITIGFLLKIGLNMVSWGLGISDFMLAVSFWGHQNRSYALGRTFGHAYLSWESNST